ncbi:NUDIX hydrolase [Candidatus Micrarchaeota archaeon]|nr:NUDIX hydrolase [Candidatus Micrarchaeota archaeon]
MDWKILSESVEYENPWFKVLKKRVDTGLREEDWFLTNSNYNAVIIFPITQEGKIVFIKQFRLGAGKTVLELPAGFIDENESPEKAAVRECSEETGYEVEKTELIAELNVRESRTEDKDYVFVVKVGKQKTQKLEGSENIQTILLTPKEALEKTFNGEIKGAEYVATTLLCLLKKNLL